MVRHNFDNRAKYTFLFSPSKPQKPGKRNLYGLFTLNFVIHFIFVSIST